MEGTSRFRLAVLDMDGTLLTEAKEITPRTAAAVRAAAEQGVRIVLATARPHCSARPYAEALGLDTPVVCYNGALVRHPSGRTLAAHPIPASTASAMAAFCRERDLYVKVFGDDFFCVATPTAETLRYSPRYGVPFRAVGDVAAYIAREGFAPFSFVVHAPPEEIPALKDEMERRWAGAVTGDCPNEHAIHFTAAGVSKLAAVRGLAQAWGIAPDQALAVGDGGNDLDLLLWAGLGIAMANAPGEVRARAAHVTASNDEEGVALALETFVLGTPSDGRGRRRHLAG